MGDGETSRLGGRRRAPWLRVVFGFGVTVAALLWVLGRVDNPADVMRSVARCRWEWLAAALILRLALIPVKNGRWRIVLRALAGRRPGPTLAPLVLGYFASCILPLRGGELVRVQLASPPTRLSRATLFSTVVSERVIDGAILCAILSVAAMMVRVPAWVAPNLRRVVIVMGAGFVLLFLLSFRTGLGRRFEPTRLGLLVGLLRRFREGLAVFRRRPWLLVVVAGITGAVWCLEGLATCWVLNAFGIRQGYAVGLFLSAAATLALTVPTAPGSLGPHQAIYVALLGYQGVASESALAASLVSQMTMVLLLLAMGGAILLFGKVRWRDLWNLRGVPARS